MTLDQANAHLSALQRRLTALQHATALLTFDGYTAASKGAAAGRAQTVSVLSEEIYSLTTDPHTAEALHTLNDHPRTDPITRRQAQLLLRTLRQMERIPREEYTAFRRLMVEADAVWHEAKEKDDFPLFRPVLEQVFAAHRRIAALCAPDADPYDYWLDYNEEGLDQARCDRFFSAVRGKIVPLLAQVMERAPLPDAMLHGEFPIPVQDALSHRLMRIIGLDPAHVGLATTEHPFTITLGSQQDVRITTHYHRDDFSKSMFSVIHEGGHALYSTNVDPAYMGTVLDKGVSMGIHESQSRFFENILARSEGFCQGLFPILQELFPDQMAGYDAHDLYLAVNRVQPSLIRTQADELTYCLHIMVRYRLEQQLFSGELAVGDLPEAWNALYREYLGIDVPDDRRGVLQDCHWADGYIGYFPSYALGSAYGAQYLHKMEETVDVQDALRRGDLSPICDWLRQRIWRHGSLYSPTQVFESAVGEPFDPKYYTDYLERKFTGLYRL